MIAMLIACLEEKEREYVCVYSKEITGKLCDERLEICRCQGVQELRRVIREHERADIACIDITIPEALGLTELFRSENGSAYLILVAGLDISPVKYMKPSVHAESLILKPFQREQVNTALTTAFQTLVKRHAGPDREKVFVVDNQDGRLLIEYSAIRFFEARNKKIFLNAGTKEYGFYGTMEHLEKELGGQFIRCHRSFLINRDQIERVVFPKNLIILREGYEIPVSRTYRPVLRKMKGI